MQLTPLSKKIDIRFIAHIYKWVDIDYATTVVPYPVNVVGQETLVFVQFFSIIAGDKDNVVYFVDINESIWVSNQSVRGGDINKQPCLIDNIILMEHGHL